MVTTIGISVFFCIGMIVQFFVVAKINQGVIFHMHFKALISMLAKNNYHHWNQHVFLHRNGYILFNKIIYCLFNEVICCLLIIIY